MTKRRINCWQRCIKRRAIAPWGHKRGLWLGLRHRTGTGLWPQIFCDSDCNCDSDSNSLTLMLWCAEALRLTDANVVVVRLWSSDSDFDVDPVSQFGSVSGYVSNPLLQPASLASSHAREACSSSALNLWPQWHIVKCNHRPFQQAAISFLSCLSCCTLWESPARRVSLKGACTQITRRQPAVCHGCCCCCCCCVK